MSRAGCEAAQLVLLNLAIDPHTTLTDQAPRVRP
jgi:hypothetical protein